MTSGLEVLLMELKLNVVCVSDIYTSFQYICQGWCLVAHKYVDLSGQPVVWPSDIIGKRVWLITDMGVDVDNI